MLLLAIGLTSNAQNNPFQPAQKQDGWKTENQLLGNIKIKKRDSLVSANQFK
jgi:hypothetical protein